MMSGRILSIDIQEELISGVVMYQHAARSAVENYGVVDLGDRSLDEALSDLIGQMDFTDGVSRISIAAERFFYKNLSLPFSERKKIDKVLPFELEDSSPIAIDDLVVDAVTTRSETKRTDVIAAMLPGDYLTDCMALAAKSGLNPEIVSVSGVDIVNKLTEIPDVPRDFLFLDIGLNKATIILVQSARIALIRAIGFDGSASLLGHGLEIDRQQILDVKEKDLPPGFNGLVTSINQTLRATLGYPTFPIIYLNGSDERLAGLPEQLKHYFNVEIRKCDLRNELSFMQSVSGNSGNWVPGIMNQALALGLRSVKEKNAFNLRKGGLEHKLFLRTPNLSKTRIAIATAVLTVLIFSYLTFDFFSLKLENRRLNTRIDTVFSDTIPAVTRIEDPVGQLQAEVNRMRYSEGRGIGNGYEILDLLTEISKRIPATNRVRLTQMVVDDRGIRLKGKTDSFNAVDRIKQELDQSPLFQSVTFTSANLATKGEGIRFDLKIQLNGP